MVADWVEVAQDGDLPFWVAVCEIAEDFFDGEFGPAVRIDDANADSHILGVLDGSLLAIDTGGGREDDFLDAVGFHGIEEIDGTIDVGLVVAERLGDRLGDGFEAGEMHDRVDLVLVKNFVDG